MTPSATSKRFQSTRPIRGATPPRCRRSTATLFQSTRPIRGATNSRRFLGQGILKFQSTRPIRGATIDRRVKGQQPENFNPRAPYGARPLSAILVASILNFNPRAPYGARLSFVGAVAPLNDQFQSTRPIRGATWRRMVGSRVRLYFNPRAPYGARQMIRFARTRTRAFQSTRPIRGATNDDQGNTKGKRISIHAPHTGRDAPAPARAGM